MMRTNKYLRGMTLAEILVTLAILGFTVPLILAATASSLCSRQASEFDTRANWILRDVQQRIDQAFPTQDTPEQSIEWFYDQDGELVKNVSEAAYLVRVLAKIHQPENQPPSPIKLVKINITIHSPAKITAKKRNRRDFHYITTSKER